MCNTHAALGFLHSYDVIFTAVFKQNISIVKTYITATTYTLNFCICTNKTDQCILCTLSGITQNLHYYAIYTELRIIS